MNNTKIPFLPTNYLGSSVKPFFIRRINPDTTPDFQTGHFTNLHEVTDLTDNKLIDSSSDDEDAALDRDLEEREKRLFSVDINKLNSKYLNTDSDSIRHLAVLNSWDEEEKNKIFDTFSRNREILETFETEKQKAYESLKHLHKILIGLTKTNKDVLIEQLREECKRMNVPLSEVENAINDSLETFTVKSKYPEADRDMRQFAVINTINHVKPEYEVNDVLYALKLRRELLSEINNSLDKEKELFDESRRDFNNTDLLLSYLRKSWTIIPSPNQPGSKSTGSQSLSFSAIFSVKLFEMPDALWGLESLFKNNNKHLERLHSLAELSGYKNESSSQSRDQSIKAAASKSKHGLAYFQRYPRPSQNPLGTSIWCDLCVYGENFLETISNELLDSFVKNDSYVGETKFLKLLSNQKIPFRISLVLNADIMHYIKKDYHLQCSIKLHDCDFFEGYKIIKYNDNSDDRFDECIYDSTNQSNGKDISFDEVVDTVNACLLNVRRTCFDYALYIILQAHLTRNIMQSSGSTNTKRSIQQTIDTFSDSRYYLLSTYKSLVFVYPINQLLTTANYNALTEKVAGTFTIYPITINSSLARSLFNQLNYNMFKDSVLCYIMFPVSYHVLRCNEDYFTIQLTNIPILNCDVTNIIDKENLIYGFKDAEVNYKFSVKCYEEAIIKNSDDLFSQKLSMQLIELSCIIPTRLRSICNNIIATHQLQVPYYYGDLAKESIPAVNFKHEGSLLLYNNIKYIAQKLSTILSS